MTEFVLGYRKPWLGTLPPPTSGKWEKLV